MMKTGPEWRARAGFVLIELVVVVGLIAVVAAVAFPYLVPVLAYGRTEGAARHLANFGQRAMAQSVLMRERITVRFDLDAQEYWCVRWIEPEDEWGNKLFDEKKDEEGEEEEDVFDMSMFGTEDDDDVDQEALYERGLQMQDTLDGYAQRMLLTRVKNVRHEETIMDEFGPLFEKNFSLDLDDEGEPQEEELSLPLLHRTRLPVEVKLESVELGEELRAKGLVEVEISPVGLLEPVVFHVKGEEDDEFTVEWDPITGLAIFFEGEGSRV